MLTALVRRPDLSVVQVSSLSGPAWGLGSGGWPGGKRGMTLWPGVRGLGSRSFGAWASGASSASACWAEVAKASQAAMRTAAVNFIALLFDLRYCRGAVALQLRSSDRRL